jgi:hypothetical protein
MFAPEVLFVRNIDGLRAILKEPSADRLFDSAHLLRQLLVDGNPILHQANRAARLKITFFVNRVQPDPPGLPEPVFRQIAEGISPSLVPKPEPQALNLDGFLRHPVLQIQGDWATVRDIIQNVANYAGAVHKSTPDTPMTKSLEAVGRAIEVGGVPSVLRSLFGIIDVAVRGCEPLYARIKEAAAPDE